MIRDRDVDDDKVDYGKLGAHEFKVREMEQQVCVFLSFHLLLTLRKVANHCAGGNSAAGE